MANTVSLFDLRHCFELLDECLQVRKLLSSAEPTTVRIANAPEVGDPEMQALQQARLLALGMRTMTLPLGRGALTLGTAPPRTLFAPSRLPGGCTITIPGCPSLYPLSLSCAP